MKSYCSFISKIILFKFITLQKQLSCMLDNTDSQRTEQQTLLLQIVYRIRLQYFVLYPLN